MLRKARPCRSVAGSSRPVSRKLLRTAPQRCSAQADTQSLRPDVLDFSQAFQSRSARKAQSSYRTRRCDSSSSDFTGPLTRSASCGVRHQPPRRHRGGPFKQAAAGTQTSRRPQSSGQGGECAPCRARSNPQCRCGESLSKLRLSPGRLRPCGCRRCGHGAGPAAVCALA